MQKFLNALQKILQALQIFPERHAEITPYVQIYQTAPPDEPKRQSATTKSLQMDTWREPTNEEHSSKITLSMHTL
ncbi:MAG: hypothetical protein IKU63_05435 [Bacteroidaceae bacterium]|nr:hypothetical protein [Bacteroidaceae bacterium]